jgi:spore coat polysaccharide biosynthesis protein SpsF
MYNNEQKYANARIIASIEARMSSTRLPGKVLMQLAGKPVLSHIVERLRASKYIHDIVVATTTNPADEPIINLCRDLGVLYFRGSEEDVLSRVVQAGRFAKAELLVEITGDCPLIDPLITDRVIESFLKSDADYCSNGLDPENYVRGLDVEIYPLSVIEEVDSITNDPVDREHVSYFIYRHPEKYALKSADVDIPAEARKLRLTIDYPEDFEFVHNIFEALYHKKGIFGLSEILNLIAEKPHLLEINAKIIQKAVGDDPI